MEYNLTLTKDELSELYRLMRIGMISIEGNENNTEKIEFERKIFSSVREKIMNIDDFKENFNEHMDKLEEMIFKFQKDGNLDN